MKKLYKTGNYLVVEDGNSVNNFSIYYSHISLDKDSVTLHNRLVPEKQRFDLNASEEWQDDNGTYYNRESLMLFLNTYTGLSQVGNSLAEGSTETKDNIVDEFIFIEKALFQSDTPLTFAPGEERTITYTLPDVLDEILMSFSIYGQNYFGGNEMVFGGLNFADNGGIHIKKDKNTGLTYNSRYMQEQLEEYYDGSLIETPIKPNNLIKTPPLIGYNIKETLTSNLFNISDDYLFSITNIVLDGYNLLITLKNESNELITYDKSQNAYIHLPKVVDSVTIPTEIINIGAYKNLPAEVFQKYYILTRSGYAIISSLIEQEFVYYYQLTGTVFSSTIQPYLSVGYYDDILEDYIISFLAYDKFIGGNKETIYGNISLKNNSITENNRLSQVNSYTVGQYKDNGAYAFDKPTGITQMSGNKELKYAVLYKNYYPILIKTADDWVTIEEKQVIDQTFLGQTARNDFQIPNYNGFGNNVQFFNDLVFWSFTVVLDDFSNVQYLMKSTDGGDNSSKLLDTHTEMIESTAIWFKAYNNGQELHVFTLCQLNSTRAGIFYNYSNDAGETWAYVSGSWKVFNTFLNNVSQYTSGPLIHPSYCTAGSIYKKNNILYANFLDDTVEILEIKKFVNDEWVLEDTKGHFLGDVIHSQVSHEYLEGYYVYDSNITGFPTKVLFEESILFEFGLKGLKYV